MNRRLKIICTLLIFSYLVMIVHAIMTEIVPSITAKSQYKAENSQPFAYESGKELGQKLYGGSEAQSESSSVDQISKKRIKELLYMFIQPVNGYYTLPTLVKNQKTGETITAEVRQLYVNVNWLVKDLPPWYNMIKITQLLLSILILFVMIYIPVQSFRVLRSIIKDEIFDIKNIRRIRRIGYSLLLCFIVAFGFGYATTLLAKEMISLENYKILFSIGDDSMFLLFGLVVLLFAEVLKISHMMKEEQDLTV